MAKWTQYQSGLLFREDEFSWQGASPQDDRFFLRRLKTDPSKFSDFLMGSLTEGHVSVVFRAFLDLSGGLKSELLTFTSVAALTDACAVAEAKLSRIERLVIQVCGNFGCAVSGAKLEKTEAGYSVIVDLSRF